MNRKPFKIFQIVSIALFLSVIVILMAAGLSGANFDFDPHFDIHTILHNPHWRNAFACIPTFQALISIVCLTATTLAVYQARILLLVVSYVAQALLLSVAGGYAGIIFLLFDITERHYSPYWVASGGLLFEYMFLYALTSVVMLILNGRALRMANQAL